MKETDIRLKDFKHDERVLIIARRHWFVFLAEAAGIFIVYILPFFFFPILSVFLAPGTATPPPAVGIFLASLWSLIVWQVLFSRWTNYHFDIWIITNWRIVDIEQKALFRRNTSTLFDLAVIQDITVEQNGIIQTFLNFGSIQIQTAAATREFVMDNITNPKKIERVVRIAQQEKKKVKSAL